ncbi:hypothetical protein SAMN05660324_1997 [Klenkia brasiliensis]|uniref:SnoaL-like domain-containing protein n=1 Tax=Klenkia brasiliensis TaxID=333142 RepID=A0A1G7SER4_9ACTN|nr:hypothetical protein SAMN05660324_1997 [Klenkia brasiliensis]
MSSASTSSAAPEQQAAAEAVALVQVYWQTVDQLYTDPSLSIDGLYDVAVDPEATSEAATLQAFRTSGYTQTGQSRVVSTTTGAVDLDSTGEAGDLPTVRVTACIDVTQVGATDTNGASVVAPDQAPYLVADMTIVNIAYPDPAAWRVSSAPNTQAQACPG